MGVKPKVSVLPGFMVSILALFIPLLKEVKDLSYQLKQDYCFDSSKIEKAFGLNPIGLEEGLKKCLE
jgi:nucleoside-diphosphate-sugar epimerase